MNARNRADIVNIPSCVYSSMVFFSPTLKPSVLEAARSSSWWSVIVTVVPGLVGYRDEESYRRQISSIQVPGQSLYKG